MEFTVNGQIHEIAEQPARSLLHVLREELELTGAKYGCGEGECGACTVLVDGQARRSCVTPAGEMAGRSVVTIEGLAGDVATQRLNRAFAEQAAFQCGYCTPGMLVSATALLRSEPRPDHRAIVAAMDGNLCRCGTYGRIESAIEAAADAGPALEPAALGAVPAQAQPARPPRPWESAPPGERNWFDVLGPGLVALLTADEMERVEEELGAGWSTPGGGWLHVSPAGRVTGFTGKVDVGQGNRLSLRRLTAAEFGTSLENVSLVMGDTDFAPHDLGTFGSRSTADAGMVLRLLAATAREAMAELGELSDRTCEVRPATADAPLYADISSRLAALEVPQLAQPGTSIYTSDMPLPGLRHGEVLRPPVLGARLDRIESTAAASIPGVVVVRDGDFVGVTAPDPLTARRAVDALDAKWIAPPAMPLERELEAHLRAHPVESEGWEGNFERTHGDPARAFHAAATVVAATYRTAYVAHMPLETRAALAEVDEAGRLTVWTGTQRPFPVRRQIAEALGIAEETIRVIVPPTGSGYGGKHTGEAAIEAARLAKATGKPVKVRWRRPDEFEWAYFRPAAVIDVRAGLDDSGRLLAWEHINVNSGANAIGPPYEIANVRLAYQAAASPLRQGSWRALAASANCFARESLVDEIAAQVGADPYDFRIEHLTDLRLVAALKTVVDRAARWPRPNAVGEDARIGVGIACGIEKGGRVASAAQITVAGEGPPRVERLVTAYDCGLVVDRDNLVNQLEGAAVMGLSAAMFEAIHFDDGQITNPSLSTYRVARFSDAPLVEVVSLDQPDEPSAGAGETPVIAIAPAIANAIHAATGRRLRSLPLIEAWSAG